MIHVPAMSYFFNELMGYIVICIVIYTLTRIKSKLFWFCMLLVALPLTLVSMMSFMVYTLSLLIICSVLRYSAWKKDKLRFRYESLGILLSIAIDMSIDTIASFFLAILQQRFLVGLSEGETILMFLVYGLFRLMVEVFLARIIRRIILRMALTLDELNTMVLNILFFTLAMMVMIEVMRSLKVFGIHQLLIIAFLIVQVIFSLNQTFSSLRKLKRENELVMVKNELQVMASYTEQIEQSYQEMRKFKHDYKNILLGLSLSVENEQDKAYIHEAINYSDELLKKSVMRFTDLTNVKDTAVKSLVITKLAKAQQEEIVCVFECVSELLPFMHHQVIIIRALGILLDNAIEAATSANDKKMTLLILQNDTHVEFIIENSYAGGVPKINDLQKKGYSTKGSDRGLGLHNLSEMVQRYGFLDVNFSVTELAFKSSLMIEKEEV